MDEIPKQDKPGEVVLMKDGDGHLYAVPVDLRHAFSSWVEYMESDSEEEWDGCDYGQYVLGSHLSCYSFIGPIQEGL